MSQAKIGLLGTGFVADLYMQSLRFVRDCDVVACFSRDEESARAFADKWNIPEHTTDMDALINSPAVDLVIVAVPHNAHAAVVPKIAAANKAVI